MNGNDRGYLSRLFPGAGAELRRLLRGAVANGLEAVDLYTIADLQELSGYKNEELAALIACMFLALREGSVCLEASRDALLRRLDGIITEDEARAWADRMLASLAQGSFPELIGASETDAKPLIQHTLRGNVLLYFQKYLKHERALQTLLRQRLAARPEPALTEELCARFGARIAAAGVKLGAEQKLAIGLALLRDFVVISGGPGTGKTTIVATLLNCLLQGGCETERIALACPTGRAAQRLTESLRSGGTQTLAAQTLHKLLAFSPRTGTFGHHRENPLAADVVVVDEVSMVDVVLMSRLLEALGPSTRLVLLGDKDQLPSVDAGSVLADLMPKDGRAHFSAAVAEQLRRLTGVGPDSAPGTGGLLTDAVVILRENYRSQQLITAVAREINELGDADGGARAQQIVVQLPRLKLESEPRACRGAPAWAPRAATWGCPYFTWPSLAVVGQAFQLAQPAAHVGGPGQAGKLVLPGCYFLDHNHRPELWRLIQDAWARRHYVTGQDDGAAYLDLTEETRLPAAGEMPPALEGMIRRILAVVNGARVLTLIREGPWGCAGVNAHIARLLHPRGRAKLFAGAPVLVTANDYALQLFNGDVGVALNDSHGALRVVFERQDESGRRTFMVLPVDTLPSHELAFAMTVHKSQGSEYGQVLLVLPPEGAQRLQNRELIYTAITRARHLAVCYGPAAALSAAIRRALVKILGIGLSGRSVACGQLRIDTARQRA